MSDWDEGERLAELQALAYKLDPDPEPEEDDDPYDGKFPREHLKVERLYYEQPTGMYFYTPDGIGCIWYETREEALEDTGAFDQPIITLVQELSDF